MPHQTRTALLVMDYQNGIVERIADADGGGAALLERAAQAIATAREASIPVIYVRVAFRPGSPEISPSNRSFAALSGSNAFSQDEPATQIHAAVAPQEGDVVVIKRRVSAFAGSDLEVVLRAGRVQRLVLAGISTSGVVLSTLREAADRDFELVVLADACADGDEEVHRVLTEKVYPRQADVLTVAEWVLQQGSATS
jgi:nicotinamidase-related amidase